MLPDTPLSFVDVETTGTSVPFHRVLEIGIVRLEKGRVTRKFSSVINPQTHVDPFILSMTGISQKEVDCAPSFREIADAILEILDGSFFVAHNVRFDYGFLRNEFKRLERTFSFKHFCTVKLARRLFPGMQHYSLDALIARHNLSCTRRHRAFDDAKAICDFYCQSHRSFGNEVMEEAIRSVMKRPSIPIGIDETVLDELPDTPGVYMFSAENGFPLYIGKSINIRDRVLSHFSGDYLSSSDMKIAQQVKSIEYVKTAGELGALFLESTLIKKQQPLFNRQLRYSQKLVVLKKLQDPHTYNTVSIEELRHIHPDDLEDIIGIFRSKKQARDSLNELAKEKSLCPKLLQLESSRASCFWFQLGICRGACTGKENPLQYNVRFDEAFFRHKIQSWPFDGPIVISETGDFTEHFIIDRWCYVGSLRNEDSLDYPDMLPLFDYDMYKILRKFLTTPGNLTKIRSFPTPHPSSDRVVPVRI